MFRTVYPQSLARAGEQRVRHVITNLMHYFLDHPEEMRDEPGRARADDHGQLTFEVAEPAAEGEEGWAATAAPGDAGAAARGAGSLERIQAVTDYISGMTDRYALSRYRELFEPRSWPAP
jgi:dGTP triphosphohydrolase